MTLAQLIVQQLLASNTEGLVFLNTVVLRHTAKYKFQYF